MIPLLNRSTGLRLLGCFPELTGQCPCLNRFTAKNWGCRLLPQTQLADLCPAEIEIPEKGEKRIQKKSGIPRGPGQTGWNRKKTTEIYKKRLAEIRLKVYLSISKRILNDSGD